MHLGFSVSTRSTINFSTLSSFTQNFKLYVLTDVALRTKTREESVFKSKLEEITVDGGGDCPEAAMAGISLGIDESLPYSLFYVSTDATAKDIKLYEEVKRKALKKFIQVCLFQNIY